ncbi:hypothetical protein H257_09062 [Aphanomyces astaci]|uniref:Uncharacterized protein n=1 Tax=Aphanomyces astaci TaxID=112090 RepID=W4GD27_APHAT|nr:hypothetical protein H257_09062 [Aphanomyces astaci]ETV77176.1 hypothetical protein H257_09062 [Aphanomyces astaci]|eukprot:XP_009833482.1 hypothetical protein H257_09062 [Aphanomyces astaci]
MVDYHADHTAPHSRLGPLAQTGPRTMDQGLPQTSGLANYQPTPNTDSTTSNRDEVAAGLPHLLDNWIPPAEKTTRPRHLHSGLETDRENVSISSATGYSRTWTDLTKLHKPSNPLRALPGTPTTTMKTCKPAATAASAPAYPQDMGASPRNSGSLPLHAYEQGNG